ncbi:ATP-binding protein [Bailinhaonella thermotolerans]|uniref:ATP-binding protein n=1 Tax=Bailinhaonella thermotolerans TaxID=1070861 RepID=A0A3A4BFQ1_9ACTN|nr:ATP-binding protein [Bailinhaonella thermotolerans]RJL33312.1 ATP-binding protein [Bailinhaonella thermotolerans]
MLATRPVTTVTFPGQEDHVPAVRAYVRVLYEDHPRLDDLLLILTELITNAVRHTRSGERGGAVTVNVLGPPYEPRFEIQDQGGKAHSEPRHRDPADAEGGYGLRLVEALASRWGADSWPGGTRTWFEIR